MSGDGGDAVGFTRITTGARGYEGCELGDRPESIGAKPRPGIDGKPELGLGSVEALAAAAPAAEDPSPEMMVVVNDYRRTTLLVDAGAEISMVDKDTWGVTNLLLLLYPTTR